MKKIELGLLVLVLAITIAYLINNKESDAGFLNDEFTKIEQLVSKRDAKNTQVSSASVAWHLDHMLKTINQISDRVIDSNPDDYTYNFNIQQVVVHTTGMIPRGAAQSPQNVRPPKVIQTDSIYIQLKDAKTKISKLISLDEDAYFEHPVFDNLDRDQTRRFLEIHTKHHLKIIKDILDE